MHDGWPLEQDPAQPWCASRQILLVAEAERASLKVLGVAQPNRPWMAGSIRGQE